VKVLTLRGRLRRGNFQLLIGMTTLPAIKLLLASAGLGVPVVVSERNYPPSRSLSWPWRLLRRLLYPTATLHLVQTERIAAWLRDAGLARATATLPNRIVWPLPRHPPVLDPASLLEPGSRVLLAVGTKIHQKGFDRLVTVFAELAAAFPDWTLVILGIDERPYHGVDQRQALRALLPADRQLRQRVLFPGRVGNGADWYLRADLFVLSSRYEGFPNVLLEAMAAGCACLAVDCPTGPAEIIDHGRTGWLLEEAADVSRWVAALSLLMADEGLRRCLGAGALEVRDTYSPAVISRRFTALVASPGDGH
jgi:glycosyltransferase involved in cell wall biosynthesis